MSVKSMSMGQGVIGATFANTNYPEQEGGRV